MKLVIFFGQFFEKKNTQIHDFVKIRQVGTELPADGRTDGHDDANSYLSEFYECA